MRATALLRIATGRNLLQQVAKGAAASTATGTLPPASPLGRARPDEAASEYIPAPRSWRRGSDVKLHVKTSLGEEDIVIQTSHGGRYFCIWVLDPVT
jgi:hypothetical protein